MTITPLERRLLWGSSLAVTATGAAYLVMKRFLVADDPFAVVNHPWQPAMLKLHLLTAPVLVFALGMILMRHVVAHWTAGQPVARRSGIGTALLLAPMVVSGYLIQAVTAERPLEVVAWAHTGAGLLYAALFGAHQLVVQRRQAAASRWRRAA